MTARIRLDPPPQTFHREPAFVEYLEKRGITEASADTCQMKSLRPAVHARVMRMPWLEDHDIAGGAIPYFDVKGKLTGFRRTRVIGDVPAKAGKKPPKFIQETDSASHLYFSPQRDWVAIAKDPKQDILIAEGEVKAVACNQLQSFNCLAIAGVWCWAKKTDTCETRLIADFSLINWKGRNVYVVFDSDSTTNADVMKAEARFLEALYVGGARPFCVRLPSTHETGNQGLDDFLVGFDANRGALELSNLLAAAQSPYVPTIATSVEVANMSTEEPKQRIATMLPEFGAALLASAPKCGKSFFVLQAVHAVATHTRAFGSRATMQCEALYIALEDKFVRIKDRMARMGLEPVQELTIAHTWPREEAAFTALDRRLEERPNLKFVVIDTWARFRPRKMKNEDPYEADYAMAARLKAIADKHRALVLIVHHTRKSKATDPFETVLGSTGLTAAMDVSMVLQRKRAESEGVLYATGRDIEEVQLAVSFAHEENCLWTIDGQARTARALSPAKQQFMRVLREADGPMRMKDVAAGVTKLRGGVECSWPNATQMLRRLINDDQVVRRTEAGLYEIASNFD